MSLSSFGISMVLAFKISLKVFLFCFVFLSLILLEEFEKDCYYIFLKSLVDCQWNQLDLGFSVLEGFWLLSQYLLTCYWSVSYFFKIHS